MKQTPELDGIPVVLMSAIPPKVRRGDYRWDVFLRKPFTIEVLLETVRARVGAAEGTPG